MGIFLNVRKAFDSVNLESEVLKTILLDRAIQMGYRLLKCIINIVFP